MSTHPDIPKQNAPVVDLDPKILIPRQTIAEMSQSRVNKLRKKIRKNGFDLSYPIAAANIERKLIIIDGHHRTQAAVREQLPSIPVQIYILSPEKGSEYLIQASEAAEYRRYD